MMRMGYDDRLATASVAAGGTLGSLIPPSVLFIIYGIFTETSISRLFLAGVLPGVLSLAGFLLVIYVWVSRRPEIAPPRDMTYTAAERRRAALDAWPAILLFVIIVGGIYGGIFSATEAAAVAAALATIVGFMQKKLTLGVVFDCLKATCVQSASIFIIAASANVLPPPPAQ